MVKPGYKQTEVGVIPEKWTISTIGAIADVKTGPFGSALHAEDYVQDGTPIITVEHLGETGLTHQNLPKVSEKDRHRLFAYSMQEGDIVFSRVGSVDRNAYVTAIENGWLFSGRILRLRAKNEKLSTQYLGYYFKSEDTKERIRNVAVGQTMPSLNTKLMNAFKVVLPTIEEQKDIAALLSNMDTLISALEKQISKKKAIKQGAMQELLTGKRRLPGFSGEWQNIVLGTVSSFYNGGTPSKTRKDWWSGNIPWISSSDLSESTITSVKISRFVSQEAVARSATRICPRNAVLIVSRVGVGKVAVSPCELCTSQDFTTIVSSRHNPYFLAYMLMPIMKKLAIQSQGTSIKGITTEDIQKIAIPTPSEEEQNAIVDILADTDSEIEALEQKLKKYRQVKQGMMQQLLTGKIRLKNDVVDSVHTEQKASTKKSPVRSAHNHQFDDAVSIAAIVDAFYSDKYPLGRVKVQKLLYLLHRHQGVCVSDFKKKAAGPYADTVRYKGGEPIAKKNKYIVSESGKQGTRYFRGENMAQALDYVERWGMQADLQWLKDNFLHASRNDLELFATVDMAMCDLDEVGISVSVESIKNLIASNKEWKAKLSKTYFSDWDIARAIKKCTELFN